MKRCIQALLLGLILTGSTSLVAQNGAVIDRGTYPDYFGTAYNPAEGLTYFFSTFSDVCGFPVEPGDVLELPWMIVHRPKDDADLPWDGKYLDHGFFFMRVLMTTEDEFWSDPCGTWSNPDLIFADGMFYSTFNDNDQFPSDTNRANVWGFEGNGALEDFGDNCKGEMVGLKWSWRGKMNDDFPACQPECDFVLLKQVGPELKCN